MVSQSGTWSVFRGNSSTDSDKVASIKPKLIQCLGNTIRISRVGESDYFLTIKVLPVPYRI